MGLKDLRIPTETVEVPGGGEFAVRGLSFVDLRLLVSKHASELAEFFDLVANGSGELAITNAAAVAGQFINDAPAIAAEVIALASGEKDVFEIALALPFPVQVDALTKIGKLTFASEDSAKKFLQTVRSLITVVQSSDQKS
jgi:hypothetical protein